MKETKVEFKFDERSLVQTDCDKPGCKKDCCGKPNIEDHCMRGMFCVHCGRAFCIQEGIN